MGGEMKLREGDEVFYQLPDGTRMWADVCLCGRCGAAGVVNAVEVTAGRPARARVLGEWVPAELAADDSGDTVCTTCDA